MKKITALVIACTLILSLSSCGRILQSAVDRVVDNTDDVIDVTQDITPPTEPQVSESDIIQTTQEETLKTTPPVVETTEEWTDLEMDTWPSDLVGDLPAPDGISINGVAIYHGASPTLFVFFENLSKNAYDAYCDVLLANGFEEVQPPENVGPYYFMCARVTDQLVELVTFEYIEGCESIFAYSQPSF